MSDRPHILVIEGTGRKNGLVDRLVQESEVVRTDNLSQAISLLNQEHFDLVCADLADSAVCEGARNLLQARQLLEALQDGVAVVDVDLHIVWANPSFDAWCDGSTRSRAFYDALGSPEILGPNYSPFHTALSGKSASTRLHCRDNRYLELQITPILDSGGKISQMITLARDITAQVQQQQKLDALHKAGGQLAPFTSDQISEMSVAERIELLKANIRQFTRDLLHYDVIEIRLLELPTSRLETLLEDGMTAEAAGRVLYASPTGNGVTGFVAATGKSYLCSDTAEDPLYIEGSAGARSSLTVPLLYEDRVIGTFNVESPKPNEFGEDDLQFAEIFCREIASALHTLELLSAEKHSTATQSIEAISREVALPVDDILAAATTVLDRYIGHDPEMAAKLRQILAGARAIKQSIQKVGMDLAPARSTCRSEDANRTRLEGLRVLVADNDERVRRSAHGILGRWGCVVETARDGQEALTMARLGTYDAILADIRLPDISGYEMYCRLRSAQPQARVILMTTYGYDASHSLVKARQEGLRCVLYKPFRIDQLRIALEAGCGEPSAPASTQPEVARA